MDSLNKRSFHLEELMSVISESLSAGKSVRFAPKGTSMLPMLRQGLDSVTLSPLPDKLKKYDLPLYKRDNGQYVLHRIIAAEETYTCMGDNQFEAEHGLRQEQMIAVVTGFTRGEKEHSVKELSYQVYCRMWHYSRFVRRLWRRGKGRLRKLFH